MTDQSQAFLDLAREYDVLKFGEFTLKSGRISPYFFNLGQIASGRGMRRLAGFYAHTLAESGIVFDSLFGPAYKGIPLATAVACALADGDGGPPRDVGFTYNRKEAKDHGEGGTLVGAPLGKRVVIVDDVITAGTAVGEAIDIIEAAGSEVAALMIALDRQERARDDRSPIAALAEDRNIPTLAVATFEDVITFAGRTNLDSDSQKAMHTYRDRYGA